MGIVRRTAVRCCCRVVFALAACLPLAAHAEEHLTPPPLSVSLILPPHRLLSSLTTSVMKKELTRIWAREGVQLHWRDSDRQVPAGEAFVRITLIDDEDRPHRKQEKYVLGDFLPDEGRIRLSMFAASQAATKSTATTRRTRDTFERPLALGYILGRALAHEIGHALLGRAHAESGLMSATFNPATMADAYSDAFRLTKTESARLSLDRLTLRAAVDTDHAPVALEVETQAPSLTR